MLNIACIAYKLLDTLIKAVTKCLFEFQPIIICQWDCSLTRAVFTCVESNSRLRWFCITTLCDWFKTLAPLSRPIRSKTKSNHDALAHVFSCFEFLLDYWIVCVLCDWLEWLLWFWFYDTQLKTALLHNLSLLFSTCVFIPWVSLNLNLPWSVNAPEQMDEWIVAVPLRLTDCQAQIQANSWRHELERCFVLWLLLLKLYFEACWNGAKVIQGQVS